jgi:hypothetical protein
MQIDRDTVLDLIRERGGDADAAARELPAQIDTDQHRDLLDRFGVNPQELLGKLGGLGGTLGL